MLGNAECAATIPVKDLKIAKDFYTNKLGLSIEEESDKGGIVFKSGSSKVFVYDTNLAGTNKATAASWVVGDVEAVAKALKDKSVTLEHYDLPGVKRGGDVHVMGDLKAIWFKDTDGNILSVSNQRG